jgi:hypothetical protein
MAARLTQRRRLAYSAERNARTGATARSFLLTELLS